MSNLIIPVGIPGCGKSTWAKRLLDLKYQIVSSDEIRKQNWGTLREVHKPEFKKERNEVVWDTFYGGIQQYLTHNIDVYADATNLNDYARERLREIAERTRARTHLILFNNAGEAAIRNLARVEDERVPEDVMLSMSVLFGKALEQIPAESYDSVTSIVSVQ